MEFPDFDINLKYMSSFPCEVDNPQNLNGTEVPIEVILHIFSYLDINSLLQIGAVSRQWKVLSLENFLWKRLFFEHFPDTAKFSRKEKSPKEQFLSALAIKKAMKTEGFKPDNKTFVNEFSTLIAENKMVSSTSSKLQEVHINDLFNLPSQKKLKHPKPIEFIQYSSGKVVTLCQDKIFRIWDLESEKVIFSHQIQGFVNSLKIFENKIIYFGFFKYDDPKQSFITIYNLETGELEQSLSTDKIYVTAVCLYDGMVLIGDFNGGIWMWGDQAPTKPIIEFHQPIKQFLIGLGKLMYISPNEYTIKIYDLETGMLCKPLRGHTQEVSSFLIHNGLIFSSAHDATLRIWDPNNGKELRKLSCSHKIHSFEIARGHIICSLLAHSDHRFKVFDFINAKKRKQIDSKSNPRPNKRKNIIAKEKDNKQKFSSDAME